MNDFSYPPPLSPDLRHSNWLLEETMKSFIWVLVSASFAITGISQVSPAQIRGLPASDVLGGEDIWHNPTFVSGVANGGETATSEW